MAFSKQESAHRRAVRGRPHNRSNREFTVDNDHACPAVVEATPDCTLS